MPLSRRELLRQTSAALLLPGAAALKSYAVHGASRITTQPHFEERTQAAGIRFLHRASPTPRKYLLETMGSGVALFDYNRDGRLDLFFSNGARIHNPQPKNEPLRKTGTEWWNRLYRQDSHGRFEDVTAEAGLAGEGYCTGVAAGDFDNDGFPDLYVCGYDGNRLYHNDGHGNFTDVTADAGVGGGGWCTSAAWFDYDRDGRLDLIVCRYMEWDFSHPWCGPHRPGYRSYCHPDLFPPASLLLYHNEGNGRFREVAAEAGLRKKGKGLGVSIADYDLDGWPDVYIANDSIPEFLFHNQGNGTFKEVGLIEGCAVDGDGRPFAGMGVDFADYDNDGRPDLIVTDLGHQMYALFHNDGANGFSYQTYASGLGAISARHAGWGTRFMDYDNDGWKDLIAAQADVLDTIHLLNPDLRYRQPPLLARNLGDGRLADVSAAAGPAFRQLWAGRGLAIGDIDNDGRLDAVIATNNGPAHLLMNRTETRNHWLRLRLEGRRSNRDAIGARAKLTTTAGTQAAEVTTAGSYQSASDSRLHFGLGNAKSARELEIRWPSGTFQRIQNVQSDRELHLIEPEANIRTLPEQRDGIRRR